MDPEIGLIYQIDFDEAKMKLYCSMTLTTQFCPMGESITNAVRENLKWGYPDYEPIIDLKFDPAWNHEMISEAGKDFLNEM